MPRILKLSELTAANSTLGGYLLGQGGLPAPVAVADTKTRYTVVLPTSGARRVTLIAESTLNQIVTAQLFGSKDAATSGTADPQGNLQLTNAYTVTGGSGQPPNASIPASPSPAWVVLWTLTDLHGFLVVQFSCSIAPAAGVIDIWAEYDLGDQ